MLGSYRYVYEDHVRAIMLHIVPRRRDPAGRDETADLDARIAKRGHRGIPLHCRVLGTLKPMFSKYHSMFHSVTED